MSSDRQKLVMVVEDGPDIRLTLEAFLELEGYEVVSAENGLKALETIEAGRMPGLILLDMKMPVMDGWGFAMNFRKKYNGAAKIVVMTAAANAQQRAEEVQAADWIGKPFDLDELLIKVKRCLNSEPQSTVSRLKFTSSSSG